MPFYRSLTKTPKNNFHILSKANVDMVPDRVEDHAEYVPASARLSS